MSADTDITELAWQVAETIRALNYATLPAVPAPAGPAQLSGVVAALACAADRLPQLLGQVQAQLAGQAHAGRLRLDTATGTPAGTVTATGAALADAAVRARGAGAALHDAHELLAHLGTIPDETDCEEPLAP